MTRPGSRTITWGIMGLLTGSVYSAMSRSFWDQTPRIGEERPVGTDSATIFVRLSNVVSANCDEPAIGNLELTMEFNKQFSLAAVLRTETSTAEDEDHGMLLLEFGEIAAFRCMVGKLIVGEDSAWDDV